jgi:uncharacterized protein involved in exopolysaccharide biosynthesis
MNVERHKIRPLPGGKELPAAYGPASGKREISMLDLLVALGPYRKMILWVTLAFGLVGLALAWIVRPSYTSEVVLLPPQQQHSMATAMMSQLSSLGDIGGLMSGGLGLKNQVDLYVALFKSETIQDALIKQFDLQKEYKEKYLSNTRKDLEKHTTVKADLKSNLITITFRDHDARRAAAIANGYVQQYRDLSQHLAIGEAAQRRIFFQNQMEQAKNNLAQAEEALVQTEQKTGVVALDSQERALIGSAAALRAEITGKQAQIQSMQAYATPENPQLIEAERSLTALQDELNKMGGGGDTLGQQFMVPQVKVPKEGMEYVRRLRDVKYYTTVFEILARQFEAAKVDEAREGELVQVVDPALVPDRKSSPNRILWTVVALLAGLAVSTAIGLTRASLRWMHRDPETDRKMVAVRRMWMPHVLRRHETEQAASSGR